ncbi:uncharacterized protein LOC110676754 [Aedes aegypti]|uniref:BED-type domain-containing protein n=1 Tax=Aedes aegypti TaxID=7159 RepID=A0A6I8U204_AEDAE|nr:uncharacterized protein LOC110676754 [Aedes aegypti]
MAASNWTTVFQPCWLDDLDFKTWIRQIDHKPKSAYCSLCSSEFSLSNMGKQALKSHMRSKKHLMRAGAGSSSLLNFVKSSPTTVSVPATVTETATRSESKSSVDKSEQKSSSRVLSQFIIKNEVTEAEVLWCIQTVMSHKSLRASEKDVSVLKRMFRDSEVASKLQLKKDKIAYVVMYGIAPYFKAELVDRVNQCDFFVAGFDESMNKVTKKQQMDINIRYWDKDTNSVTARYFTSRFLTRSRATDLLEAFQEGLKMLDLSKMLQVSMDGPNVNWAFLRELKLELTGDAKLLDLGSCGLHIMHGAFKDGFQATEWPVVTFLRALYNLFKEVRARRALYVQYSGSDVFPLKFCGHRWLENSNVAKRAIDTIGNMRKFVDGVKKDKVEPKCKSFSDVVKFLNDPLICAKLTFFHSVAMKIEPLLRKLQTDDPMVPFLYTAICQVIVTLCEKFIKPDKLEKSDFLTIDDVKDTANQLTAKSVNLGFDTKKALKDAKVKELDAMNFRNECKTCFKTIVCKLLTKSPITYPLAKAASCLDPCLMVSNANIAKRRMDKLLSLLIDCGRISGRKGDLAASQYRAVIKQTTFIDLCKSYNRNHTRLDHFWYDGLGQKYPDLFEIIKVVCCLSHGNANVERGFAVNSECLFENMKEESVVAKRQVYDAVSQCGGLDKFEVNKSLLLMVRNAHSLYAEDLDRKKTAAAENASLTALKKKNAAEARGLELQRRKLLEDAQNEANALTEQINLLKK